MANLQCLSDFYSFNNQTKTQLNKWWWNVFTKKKYIKTTATLIEGHSSQHRRASSGASLSLATWSRSLDWATYLRRNVVNIRLCCTHIHTHTHYQWAINLARRCANVKLFFSKTYNSQLSLCASNCTNLTKIVVSS